MDYDADGDFDIISGFYTGETYLFERRKDGSFKQGVMLMNESGKLLMGGISVTPELVDMDSDGDLDLVVGTRDQGVRLISNVGTRAEPVWSSEPSELRSIDGEKIMGSNAHHADWDGDGVRDLLTGREQGGATWYRNVGTSTNPRYEKGRELVAGTHFEQKEEGTLPTAPGRRTKLHVTDWNGDIVTLEVTMTIDKGWHVYANVPEDSAYRATKINVELPGRMTAAGDWARPESTPSPSDPKLTLWRSSVVWERPIRLATKEPTKIVVTVTYQARGPRVCLPPARRTLETTARHQ